MTSFVEVEFIFRKSSAGSIFSAGFNNNIVMNLLLETELCEQQATKATFIPRIQKKNKRVRIMYTHRSHNPPPHPLCLVPSFHSIVPVIVILCTLHELWGTTHCLARIVASPVKDFIVAKYAVAFVPSCTWIWLSVCVCDGYVCVCAATHSHMILLWRPNKGVHRNSCMRQNLLQFHIYTLSSPFQMKIHYCVIVKFSVCRRRHTREKERARVKAMWHRQHDLRFSSAALKMRALVMLSLCIFYFFVSQMANLL